MLTEGAWRKLPKDLLVDEDFDYIESLLPRQYAYAPYMFYLAALRKADDNGIFDVEDFVIFSRLMRVDDIEIVKTIVNAMISRHIIWHETRESSICGFISWETSDVDAKKARPLSDRRKIVQEKIKEQEKNSEKFVEFATEPTSAAQNAQNGQRAAEKRNDAPQAMPPDGAETTDFDGNFSCPKNDKNAENVVNDFYDDKNAKNVVEKIETERKKEKQEEKEKTHTLEQRKERESEKEAVTGYGPLVSPPPVTAERTAAVAETKITDSEDQQEIQTYDAFCSGDVGTLAEEALSLGGGVSEESADSALFAYLNDFFVKNCNGYKPKQSAHAIRQLCAEIKGLSDDYNPPVEVAGVLCSEFKRMCDGQRAQYWKGQALLPSYMLKTRCWMELLQHAGKILATNTANNKFMAEAKKAEAEYLAEKDAISVAVRDELLKYNIDPDAPDAQRLLLIAKSREQEEKRKAAEVEAEAAEAKKVGDIF